MYTRRLFNIVEPSDLRLIHYGKKEVLALISLLEPEWDQPMAFGDNLGKKDTTPAAISDPSQRWGVTSTMPKMNVPLKLQDKRTPESNSLGLENEFEYRRLMAYLKANSSDEDRPFKAFSVSRRFYRTYVL